MEAVRYATVGEKELDAIIYEKDAKNTHKATLFSWNCFLSYLKEKNIVIDVEKITKVELDNILITFYVELRKQDGELYTKTAFRAIRHGLQRKFKSLRQLDIIDDPAFTKSDTVFKAQCVQLKKKGLAKVEHKPPICSEDIRKLYSSPVFKLNNPRSLQRKVFFEIMFYLCRRGQENIRELTKSSFAVKRDENGTEYIERDIDELTKNHRECDPEAEGGIILATGMPNCPVYSFKQYILKLNPKINTLFQRPKPQTSAVGPWYDAQVLGIKSIAKMMKNISTDAGLTKVYTNHSIRATCITLLDSAGSEARHIMSVSGHKSEASIRSYAKTDLDRKRKMSDILSSTMISNSMNKHPKLSEESEVSDAELSNIDLSAIGSLPYKRNFGFGINLLDDDSCNSDNSTESGKSKAKSGNDSTESGKNSLICDYMMSILGNNAQNTSFNNCTFNF